MRSVSRVSRGGRNRLRTLFRGAFAVSVPAGDGLRDALTLASAAASIMVEHIGVPNGSIDEYRALAATRARAVDATVTSFSVADE